MDISVNDAGNEMKAPPKCIIENGYNPIDLTSILDQLQGCLNGYCYVTGKATGMHTNAMCHCLHWLHPGERHAAIDYLKWKREHETQLMAVMLEVAMETQHETQS